MLTIEIHGLGRENAENLRGRILESIFNIAWIDKGLCAVEICGNNIKGYNGKEKPQLRLLTSHSKMENLVIIGKLTTLGLPIHTICTQVFEG